jgi:cobalt-zinc-cadmium efflux system membrane fusion protein
MRVETTDFIQARNNLIAAVTAFNAAGNQLQRSQTTENQNTFNTAQAILVAARDQLRILGNSDAEIDAIEHDPDRQKMDLGAYVLAPIAGTVTLRQVGLGQYITSAEAGASTPVYTISNLSTVWLIANVRETDASRMRVGQPIEVTVPAYPDKVFKAKIIWVAASIDPNTHRLPVRAEVENPNLELKPVMLASFRIVVGKEEDALGVPQSAVVYEGSEAHVWAVGDDSSVALRSVRTGRTMGDMVEISAGLKAGEKVITSGTLFIDRAVENDNP